MSQMEHNQGNAEMSKDAIIKLLYRMEDALTEKWKYAEKLVLLEEDNKKYLREPEEYAKDSKDEVKAVYIALIVIAGLTFLFRIISPTSWLLGLLCKLLSYLGVGMLVIGIIIAIWLTLSLKSDIKKYNKERAEFLEKHSEAEKQFEECRKHCDDAISLIPYFCPKECYEPRMLRQYISFFEEGRADTIKEARNLFDEWMHRQRMEQKADAQYEATQNAIVAANMAKDAANNAADAARAAKASADWAAHYSRYK